MALYTCNIVAVPFYNDFEFSGKRKQIFPVIFDKAHNRKKRRSLKPRSLLPQTHAKEITFSVVVSVRWCRCDGKKEKENYVLHRFSKNKIILLLFSKNSGKNKCIFSTVFQKQQIFFCRPHLHHLTNVLHTLYLLSLCDASLRLNHFHVVLVYYHFHFPPVWKFIFCIVYFMIFLFMANKDTYMHIPRRTGADIR